MRIFAAMALTALHVSLAAADAPNDTANRCEARLSGSLQAMERRPLLKEEHATALMWLRLDAREALQAGDAALCLETMEIVETLLQIDGPSAMGHRDAARALDAPSERP